MIDLGSGTMHVEARRGALCITLRGEFDLANVPELADAFARAIGPRPQDVVLDLRPVSFADGRMVRLLVDLRQQVLARGGRLELFAGREMRRVIDVAGLGEIFHLAE